MKRESTAVLVLVLALALIGIQVVYSASALNAQGVAQLQRHLVYVGLGLVFMLLLSRFDYHGFARPWAYLPIVALAFILLGLVFVPGVGVEVNGGLRWIRIWRIRFQPSEFAKLALIILLAVKLTQNQPHIKRFWRGFVPAIVVTSAFAGMVLIEPDLGTPVVMMAVAMMMLLAAGTRWSYILGSVAPAGALVYALCHFYAYRMQRLLVFLDPWRDPGDKGFQLIQSLYAFSQGSILGRGPGAGEQKLLYLPAADTDFIFAVWGEETGLIGCLLLVSAFVVLLIVSMRIAMGARDVFGALLAAGITSLIALQAVFNMAVVTGLMPTKGLPLPFISSGGSALVVFLSLMGILLNVGLQAEEPEPGYVYAHAH